jgi:hypothetical protein
MTLLASPDSGVDTIYFAEYIMGIRNFDPASFDLSIDREEFIDICTNDFNDFIRGEMSLDEMLLRPRLSSQFVDRVKYAHTGWHDIGDHVILGAVMYRRKNPV